MIPRYQIVLFSVLVLASIAMGATLWHLRERAHERLIAGEDASPTRAPEVAVAEQATLLVANDADASLQTQMESLPLPADPESRARAVLGKLLDLYAAADSTHPVPGGANSVAQVFLLPATGQSSGAGAAVVQTPGASNGAQMAVVNLTSNFVASHPAGLETETLTVLSICGTLHANLPQVTEVRFLVDGQVHPSLAGHADLTRTYFASDAVASDLAHP